MKYVVSFCISSYFILLINLLWKTCYASLWRRSRGKFYVRETRTWNDMEDQSLLNPLTYQGRLIKNKLCTDDETQLYNRISTWNFEKRNPLIRVTSLSLADVCIHKPCSRNVRFNLLKFQQIVCEPMKRNKESRETITQRDSSSNFQKYRQQFWVKNPFLRSRNENIQKKRQKISETSKRSKANCLWLRKLWRSKKKQIHERIVGKSGNKFPISQTWCLVEKGSIQGNEAIRKARASAWSDKTSCPAGWSRVETRPEHETKRTRRCLLKSATTSQNDATTSTVPDRMGRPTGSWRTCFAYILLCLRDIAIHARIRVLETRGSRGSNGDESRIGQTFLSLLRCFLAHEQ